MSKTNILQKKVNLARGRYFNVYKDKEELLKMINEAELGENVYNSNAIENSTLTLEETEKILLKIDLDRYISERELFEAKNLARVMGYIDKNAKDKNISLEMILFLHKTLISNIRDDIAGRFRAGDEFVRVGSHIAPHPKEIVERLEKTLMEYDADKTNDIIKKIARLHLDFEYTHPFIDGNGRIGRVLNNYLLIRENYVPINIKFTDRQKYYDAFREYDKFGKVAIMEEIVGLSLLQSFYKRLAYMESKKIVSLQDYAKIKKTSLSNIINKAKRGTVEAFMEKGVWRIGV
jgi:Fic family protein